MLQRNEKGYTYEVVDDFYNIKGPDASFVNIFLELFRKKKYIIIHHLLLTDTCACMWRSR